MKIDFKIEDGSPERVAEKVKELQKFIVDNRLCCWVTAHIYDTHQGFKEVVEK